METETKSLVTINPAEFGLEENKAKEIAAQFQPMLDKMVALEQEYNQVVAMSIEDPLTADIAKALRLKYVKVRTGTAEIHRIQKAFYLAGGRFVDGWKNAQIFASQGMEQKLEDIEKHHERIETARIEALQVERQSMLAPYGVENTEQLSLGIMSKQVWENFLAGTKANHEAKIAAEAKAKADAIAEQERKAKEQEEQRLENERLKAEAAIKEQELEKERKAAQAAHDRLKAEADKAKAEADKKIASEKAKTEALAAKIKAQEDAIKAEAAVKAKAEKAAQAAPDKAKLEAFAISLNHLIFPSLNSKEARDIMNDTLADIREISQDLMQKIKGL